VIAISSYGDGLVRVPASDVGCVPHFAILATKLLCLLQDLVFGRLGVMPDNAIMASNVPKQTV
jgi:hypothetical protein